MKIFTLSIQIRCHYAMSKANVENKYFHAAFTEAEVGRYYWLWLLEHETWFQVYCNLMSCIKHLPFDDFALIPGCVLISVSKLLG